MKKLFIGLAIIGSLLVAHQIESLSDIPSVSTSGAVIPAAVKVTPQPTRPSCTLLALRTNTYFQFQWTLNGMGDVNGKLYYAPLLTFYAKDESGEIDHQEQTGFVNETFDLNSAHGNRSSIIGVPDNATKFKAVFGDVECLANVSIQ